MGVCDSTPLLKGTGIVEARLGMNVCSNIGLILEKKGIYLIDCWYDGK